MNTTDTTSRPQTATLPDPTGDWLALANVGDTVTLYQRSVQDDKNVRTTTITGRLENVQLTDPEWRSSVSRITRAVRVTLGETGYTLTVDHLMTMDRHNSERDWLLVSLK